MKFEIQRGLLKVLSWAFMITIGLTAPQIRSGKIECEPAIVGQQKASLTVQFLTTIMIPVDSVLQVTVPEGTSVVTGSVQCAIQGREDTDGFTCDSDGKTLSFTLKYQLNQYQQPLFKFHDAFNAPMTSYSAKPFGIKILNADKSQVLVENNQDVTLEVLQPNSLISATITHSAAGSRVVGQETTIKVSVKNRNPIPSGGGVKIEFPKWNPKAPIDKKVGYIQPKANEALCSEFQGMPQVECQLIITPTQDTLVVKNMFPTSQRIAGDTFQFKVNQILNPLSMSQVPFVVTTWSGISFESDTYVEYTGLIDTGIAQFQATLPAKIDASQSIVTADNPVVSEQTKLSIPFQVPVPVMLELGCTILITLPDDFNVISGKLTKFSGWGIFQGYTEKLNTQVNEQQRSIKVVDQCVPYSDPNLRITIEMGELQMPALVRETKNFKIEIQDNNGMLIAHNEQGITFTPQPGTITNIQVTPQSQKMDIQEITDVELLFTPRHFISASGTVKIKMPDDLPANCAIRSTRGMQFPVQCQQSAGELTLVNPFVSKAYPGAQELEIMFKGLQLPNSERPVQGIQIETYDFADGKQWLVDRFQSLDIEFFTPHSVTFLFGRIRLNTDFTYTESKFTFQQTCATQIPVGSIVKIKVPKQITIQNSVSVQSQCQPIVNMFRDMECNIDQNRDELSQQLDGTHTITITKSIEKQLERNDEMSFEIRKGMMTPISTETTDSFEIYIYDSNGFLINFVKEALTITMLKGKQIETVIVTPTSYRVGDSAQYDLVFITPVPILVGFKLQIFVPPKINTPRAQDIKCVGAPPLVVNLDCYLNGNRVTQELQFLSNIQVGTELKITLGTMVNPGSTQQTQPFGLSIRSPTWYEVSEELDPPGGKVQMREPSLITVFDFEVFDYRQKALTTVTIKWTSTEKYPAGTIIVIDYDETQIKPSITDYEETVPCIFRQSRIVQCQFEINKIFVRGIMPTEEYVGSQMELTITNMRIDVVTPITTNSWVLTTYLEDERSAIDSIPSDMTLTFKCNYPCQTCPVNQPDVCLSCNKIEGDQILYQNKCYIKCPDGTYFSYFQCKPCDSKCKKCEYLSGTSCTECNGGSQYPFLNGKDCSQTCSYGEFGNKLTNKCEACEIPCENCIDTPQKCTSCRQDNLDKYFHNHQCLPDCPSGNYVQLEARNNVCLECDQNCEECELTHKTCTKCRAGKILNYLDQDCVDQCPLDTTIFMPLTLDKPETCEPCKTSCKTCQGTVDHCTSCRDPLSLDQNTHQCVLECDIFNQQSVSVNNVCIGCSSSCAKCQLKPDYCIECVPGTYFYRNSCLKQCPLINDYQFTPNEEGTCVIEGLICPFGWKVNEWGDACVLVNQICEENYELNADKTACVPISTFWIPFPILIAVVLTCIVPIVSKCRRRKTLLVPCFTICFSFFETVTLVVQIAQAYKYGINTTFYLSVMGLIFTFASNMFFTLMYCQQVKIDSAFKHWFPRHNRFATAFSILGLVNFKMYRLLYCKLFQNNRFDAPFTEAQVFYRPFNLTSLFAIITVALPVIVGSGIGLIYVRFGYQLFITCIEMLVIEAILVILQITEYCQQKFGNKKYYKVTKKEVEVKVCSGFPDSDDEFDELTKQQKDQSKSKPKSIKAVKSLDRIVHRMAGHVKSAAPQKQVEQEIEELHNQDMMHRQMRRCQSFKIFRPNLDEAFSGDEHNFEKQCDDSLAILDFQDFISEPASPRSKEMLYNSKFCGRMHYLNDVYKMRDQFDNVYHEPVFQTQKLLRPVDKRIQTNVLEMLGIDDVNNRNDDSEESDGFINSADKFNKRKRLSKKRIMEIPNFEYDEISGDFEADENGKFLLIQKQGRLHDKKGRLVNRRGYLVDQVGNVINKLGKLIFYAEELSKEDDELPDPFCYEKIRSLKSHKHEIQFRVALHSQIVEDKSKLEKQQMQIEQEMEELKKKKSSREEAKSIKSKQQLDQQSSVTESQIEVQQPSSVRDEEEMFIQKLTQPKQPKSKNQFVSHPVKKSAQKSRRQDFPQTNLSDGGNAAKPIFKAMRPPSQASQHRVDQLQEMIEIKDLQFNQNRSRVSSGQPRSNFNQNQGYIPGQDIQRAYANDQNKLNNQRQRVMLDQEFLGKIEDFNKQLSSRRKDFLNNSQGGQFLKTDNMASEIASQMQDRGLAHKNLNQVYGRVKQKFNHNISQTSGFQQVVQSGPSATVHRRVDSRMHELEDIYMRPRIDGRVVQQPGSGKDTMQNAIQSLDVTRQLQEIHHLKQ